jgi:exodeoxyribonuclease V beta subunit
LFARQETYGTDVTLFLIGDPKQAIYSFRGADVFAYLGASDNVSPERRFTMLTNYRSDQTLVSAVNALFLRHERPFFYKELSYPNVGAKHEGVSTLLPGEGKPHPKPFEFRFVQSASDKSYSNVALARHLPARVANQVVELLTSGTTLDGQPLAPRSIAILTRTNREAFECQRALAMRRVPSVVQGDRSVFEQPEANELKFVLAAIVEPTSASRIRAALSTDLLGLSAVDIDALAADELAWDQWVERFQLYNTTWHKEGFIQMFRQLLLECSVTHRLLAALNGERRITNVLHLAELLHTQSQLEHLGPSGLLQYLAEQCQRQEPPGDSEQVRLESDEDAVVLTTIHKSKGLEYPIVICPFMAGSASWFASKQWVMFHADGTRDQTVDLGTDQFESHTELRQQEDLSEALRLVYVALTRAKHRCLVYWGAFGNEFFKSGFAHLLYGHQNNGDLSFLRKASDHELLASLKELERDNAGIGVELEAPFDPSQEEPVNEWQRSGESTSVNLSAKRVAHRINHWQRTASFTELTRDIPHAAIQPASDHDELAASVALPPPNTRLKEQTTLVGFPGGANVGNCFHAILETMDFRSPAPATRVQEALRAHGLPQNLEALVVEALHNTTHTEFAPGLTLSRLTPEKRLNELEFMLPVAQHAHALTGQRLARAFERYPSRVVPQVYAPQVATLPFIALTGYLKGFVDLIFEFDDKWYLVDYKTNTLGDRWEHYASDRLVDCMVSSHYILQYHLYTLALHRYLQARIQGYDYEHHFGGVYYLFLRGMHPEHQAQSGVFYDKPPLARLALLSQALDGSPEASFKQESATTPGAHI